MERLCRRAVCLVADADLRGGILRPPLLGPGPVYLGVATNLARWHRDVVMHMAHPKHPAFVLPPGRGGFGSRASEFLVPTAGCYGWQIDGVGFSRVLVFKVVSQTRRIG